MDDICPKCQSPLSDIITTPAGRKLQRCSKGEYDPGSRKTTGCPYVKWLPVDPQILDEKCPKCGADLVMAVTRFGKKMKKCSTNGWDKEKRIPTGCDFVEWINGTRELLDEVCPSCGKKLVLYTTSTGKKMKKCETGGWDKVKREATGCTYVEWLKSDASYTSRGEEFLPPEPV